MNREELLDAIEKARAAYREFKRIQAEGFALGEAHKLAAKENSAAANRAWTAYEATLQPLVGEFGGVCLG